MLSGNILSFDSGIHDEVGLGMVIFVVIQLVYGHFKEELGQCSQPVP